MNFDKKQQLFTYVLSGGTLTINEEYGITALALRLTAGAGSYEGTKKLGGLISSTPIPLVANEPVTVSSEQSKYISELIIDATGGTIEIIAR
jgi:hypothetical protein